MSTDVRITLSDGDGTVIYHEGFSLRPLADAYTEEIERSGRAMAAAALNDAVTEALDDLHGEMRRSLIRLLKTGSTTP